MSDEIQYYRYIHLSDKANKEGLLPPWQTSILGMYGIIVPDLRHATPGQTHSSEEWLRKQFEGQAVVYLPDCIGINQYPRSHFSLDPGWAATYIKEGFLVYVEEEDLIAAKAEAFVERLKHYVSEVRSPNLMTSSYPSPNGLGISSTRIVVNLDDFNLKSDWDVL